MSGQNRSTRPSHAGKHVLVTGAGQGIGEALANAFGQRGAVVGVLDTNGERARAVAEAVQKRGGKASAVAADVANFSELEGAVRGLEADLGGPFDCLVNNAGISPKHEGKAHGVWEMSPGEWAHVMEVNLNGAFHCIRLLVPAMREAGSGAIVNMSSVAGRTYSPIVGAHYAASKAGLIGLTKHLAGELGPYGIRVNAIAPGRIATPMVRGVAQSVNDEQVKLTPLRRLGEPSEVADLALYLTSDEASFVTGQVCDVAGGLYLT